MIAKSLDGNGYWYLSINEEQFLKYYKEYDIDIRLFQQPPESDEDLMENYITSKLWRMNNLYQITDKKGNRFTFPMKPVQHRIYAASLFHPRLIILKSRQHGVSTYWLIHFFDDSIFYTDLRIGLMAQGKDEASALLDRTKFAYDNFPPEISNFLFLDKTKDNYESIGFNSNSTIFIRVSFRSDTLQRLHISEYGKIANNHPKRADETKNGTLQAIQPGLPVVIESTAEGDNDYKIMWDDAIESRDRAKKRAKKDGTPIYNPMDFMPLFISWVDDPDSVSDIDEEPTLKQREYMAMLQEKHDIVLTKNQRNFYVAKYRELKDKIYQEYPTTPDEAFSKTNEGHYYAKAFRKWVIDKGRIVPNLYDSNVCVDVVLDLGVDEDDQFTLYFVQRIEQDINIIHSYQDWGEGIDYYVRYCRDTGYKIDWFIVPHDIAVFEVGASRTRKQTLIAEITETLKIPPKIDHLKKTGIADGIDSVRAIIPRIKIDEAAVYPQRCFKNYSREWDPINNVWKRKPNHNQWSHGADCSRYLAVSAVLRMPTRYTQNYMGEDTIHRSKSKYDTMVRGGMSF
jgi:hypothetical protein